jgi:hypothetical protein
MQVDSPVISSTQPDDDRQARCQRHFAKNMLACIDRRQSHFCVQRSRRRNDNEPHLGILNQVLEVLITGANTVSLSCLVSASRVGIGHGHQFRTRHIRKRWHVGAATNEPTPHYTNTECFGLHA